ncbi:MAG: hypothetical protein ACT4TC_20655 [Myxococcaceae bacterium]
MAVLHNETKTLRFFLEMVDREVPAIVPGQPPPPPESVRVLGTCGVEFFDRRDKSFWPFIRLPVLYLAGKDGPDLAASVRDLTSLRTQGFAFRTGMQNEVALQVGRAEKKGFLVEVGIDLAPYLLETAGQMGEPGQELAMFRFNCVMADLVIFADQIKQELERLPPLKR